MLEPVTPTRLLWLDGEAARTFEATVVSVDHEERSVVLDATAFYPTGGYQHCDQGTIEKDRSSYAVVTDVRLDECGRVRHAFAALRGELEPGDRIEGSIQWDRRLHHTGLHSAQHVLSRCAADRFGVETGRADFSPAGGLAVLDRPLGWEACALLEDDVNRIVREDRAVSRSLHDDRVLVRIDGLDESPCRGTHVASTGEIGYFKLTHVDGRTIRYEIGHRAERVAARLANHALRAAAVLGLPDTRELAGAVERTLAARAASERELAAWCARATEREVAKARGTSIALPDAGARLLRIDLSHLKPREARSVLGKQLGAEDEVWLCLTERRSVLVASACRRIGATDLVAELVARWGVKGGGNPRFAQGGPVPLEVAAPLDEIAGWLANGLTTAD